MPPKPHEQELFDKLPFKNMIAEYSYAGVAVFYDDYPVTKGHMLFVPTRKSEEGLGYCFNRAMRIGKEMVENEEWDGFNIGVNYRAAAGQTVKWPHLHLIPRREGDIDDPEGGVRGVIPRKRKYKKKKK